MQLQRRLLYRPQPPGSFLERGQKGLTDKGVALHAQVIVAISNK